MLLLTVINNALPAISFIKNFGFKRGAIASSVAHDSHNIIAVGTDDHKHRKGNKSSNSRIRAVLAAYRANHTAKYSPLPVAGLMSAEDGYEVAAAYTEIDRMAKGPGFNLKRPFYDTFLHGAYWLFPR